MFDDSFSALDFATDARLRAALHAETREARERRGLAERPRRNAKLDLILALPFTADCGRATRCRPPPDNSRGLRSSSRSIRSMKDLSRSAAIPPLAAMPMISLSVP